MKESKVMKELHELREKHYNESRNISTEEYLHKINEGANKAMARIEAIRKAKAEIA